MLCHWWHHHRSVYSTYQVLCHVHSNSRHLLVVLADHLLDNIGEIIILRLLYHVQELLHDRPDVRSDIKLGYSMTNRRQKITFSLNLKSV